MFDLLKCRFLNYCSIQKNCKWTFEKLETFLIVSTVSTYDFWRHSPRSHKLKSFPNFYFWTTEIMLKRTDIFKRTHKLCRTAFILLTQLAYRLHTHLAYTTCIQTAYTTCIKTAYTLHTELAYRLHTLSTRLIKSCWDGILTKYSQFRK